MGNSEAIAKATEVAVAAFEESFQAEHGRLARAMYLVTGSATEADELTQEAMVRVYERWDRVQRMENPQGYLFRTALNLHRSRIRWLTTRARHLVEPTPVPDPAEVAQDRDTLARALEALSTGQRAALVLVEWLGMDQQQAAMALGIPARVAPRPRVAGQSGPSRHAGGGRCLSCTISSSGAPRATSRLRICSSGCWIAVAAGTGAAGSAALWWPWPWPRWRSAGCCVPSPRGRFRRTSPGPGPRSWASGTPPNSRSRGALRR